MYYWEIWGWGMLKVATVNQVHGFNYCHLQHYIAYILHPDYGFVNIIGSCFIKQGTQRLLWQESEYSLFSGNFNCGSINLLFARTAVSLLAFYSQLISQQCVADNKHLKRFILSHFVCFRTLLRWMMKATASDLMRSQKREISSALLDLTDFICLILSLPSYLDSLKTDCFHC